MSRSSAPLRTDDDVRDPARAPRALVFRAAGFPAIDAPEAVVDGVERASSVAELVSKLRLKDVDVLVLPYGSAFPVDAWARIRAFAKLGGSLVVLGGAPFHEPVRFENGAWVRAARQTVFAHDLLIGPAEPVVVTQGSKTTNAPGAPFGFNANVPDPKTTWALTLRLATTKDMPEEHGSAGPRDAVARALAHVVDANGVPRGCPILEIDHQRGDAAGARWIFATSDAKLDGPLVKALVQRALEGASELKASPTRASIEPEAGVEIRVTHRRFAPRPKDVVPAKAHVSVKDDAGREVFATDATLAGPNETRTVLVPIKAKLAPGLHHVTATVEDKKTIARTGFWVKDEKLLASSPKLGVSRDWLRKNGQPFPVIGTTYMASDVHRKFLFEPNPDVWDADLFAMKKYGINFVRTGLWTAWSRAMLDPGAIDENVVSAIEAFVQTAAKHGIVVCFDFFAFLPPAFGGTNHYLDPRALEGQRELLTLVASRFRGTQWVHWDLINEPSYAPPDKLWRTRPMWDAHERRAWTKWLEKKHGAQDLDKKLRVLWGATDDDVMRPPLDDDFSQTALSIDKRPRKARDFFAFANDVVAEWAARSRDVLRAAAGNETLVTLGQDEGGIFERAMQQTMAPGLDYTAVHTWWKNDDLLWDGVLTKVTEKPSLHQETGLMRLEDIHGAPWRTPESAARLLERKIAYAFAGRGTGVVEWAWNVNPYMPIDEESTIGIFRPDGTAKPELDPMIDAAKLFAAGSAKLDDFEPDPVVLVVPHARAFLGMTGAIDATKIVVRALAERFGVVPTAISDQRLSATHLQGAKLVLVPSPDVLDENVAKALQAAARSGTKVLLTGPITGDSYGRKLPILSALGVLERTRPVAMHEKTGWSASGSVAFENQLQETALRSERASNGSLVANAAGIWHEPLPLELARDREPLVRLLEAALKQANVPTMPGEWGVAARVLYAPKSALVVVVNERPEAATRKVTVGDKSIDVEVAPFGAKILIVDR